MTVSTVRAEIGEITSLPRLEQLAAEWQQLWERCPQATPFQSPAWLLPWLRRLYRGGDLWVLTARVDGRLAAVAPLFIHRHWKDFAIRQVSFIGAGVTDYADVLVDPGEAHWAAAAMLEHLAAARAHWDLCHLQELRAASPLLAVKYPEALQVRAFAAGVCPVLRLPRDMSELRARLDSKFRRDVHRAGNHIRKSGETVFETASAENLQEHLEALFRLHAARWQSRNEPGMLENEDKLGFHREVADAFGKVGGLRVYSMRFRGEVASVVYAFAGHERAYAYLGGFDPALAKMSPGAVTMEYAIEESIKEGLTEFDFLRKEEEYKYLWGSERRVNQRLLLWHADSRLPSTGFPDDEPYEY